MTIEDLNRQGHVLLNGLMKLADNHHGIGNPLPRVWRLGPKRRSDRGHVRRVNPCRGAVGSREYGEVRLGFETAEEKLRRLARDESSAWPIDVGVRPHV